MLMRCWLVVTSLVACGSPSGPAAPEPLRAPPTSPAAGATIAAPVPSAPGTASSSSRPPAFRECGPIGCKAFASATEAFDYVMTTEPRVLAVGEAHAQAAGPKLPSTTRRFMDDLLPRLAPRARHLVIELWVAPGSCGKVEEQVQKQQQAVTAPQAATNQNEFLELGHRAKALGIMPHALVPTCEQYRRIASAGAADVEEMLAMLKTVTARDVTELLAKTAPERLIIAYGGAMHNDVVPRPGREDFTFGPELAQATEQRYVELDLVLPEQIKDSESWRALPWYAQYPAGRAESEAYLFSWSPRAYALIFPKTTLEGAP